MVATQPEDMCVRQARLFCNKGKVTYLPYIAGKGSLTS